jgi:hypothetical protein
MYTFSPLQSCSSLAVPRLPRPQPQWQAQRQQRLFRQPSQTKNASNEIEGRTITLANGMSELELHLVLLRKSPQYFGNGRPAILMAMVSLMLTRALEYGREWHVLLCRRCPKNWRWLVGTNAVLLGDRIAPQTTELRDGSLIVNFAERRPGEPMTTPPSAGVSKYLKVVAGKLVER